MVPITFNGFESNKVDVLEERFCALMYSMHFYIFFGGETRFTISGMDVFRFLNRP